MNPEGAKTEKTESKERKPAPFATIFVVRHGASEYKEELVDPDTETDLTDEGRNQIQDLAQRINMQLQEGERIYVMRSPRVRTRETARILQKGFTEAGHEIIELGAGRPSLDKLKDVNRHGEEIKYTKEKNKAEYLSEVADIMERKGPNYYIKLRQGLTKELVTENLDGYKTKVITMMRRLIEIARKNAGHNEKLVLITHGEWLDTLLEEYFGTKIEKPNDKASFGETIRLQIFPDKAVFDYKGREIEVSATTNEITKKSKNN